MHAAAPSARVRGCCSHRHGRRGASLASLRPASLLPRRASLSGGSGGGGDSDSEDDDAEGDSYEALSAHAAAQRWGASSPPASPPPPPSSDGLTALWKADLDYADARGRRDAQRAADGVSRSSEWLLALFGKGRRPALWAELRRQKSELAAAQQQARRRLFPYLTAPSQWATALSTSLLTPPPSPA